MKILLCVAGVLIFFFTASCRKKEDNIIPPIVTPTSPVVSLPIIGFSLNTDVGATISNLKLDNGLSQNQIIIVLPETFTGDEIVPMIKLSDDVESISPKSGEKISFEGRPPVEYTVTKKDGKTETYLLYVQRKGDLKIELLTKEISIVASGVNKIQLKLLNMGTLLLPESGGSRFYVDLKASYDNNNARISFDNARYEDNKITFEFYKAKTGKVSLKLSTFTPIIRESVTFNATINRGNEIFINYFSELLKDNQNKIEGINFNEKKQYKVRLESDFITPSLEFPLEFISENELRLSLPNSIENTGYNLLFFEDNILFNSFETIVKPSVGSDLTVFPSFFMMVNDYQNFLEKSVITSTENFKFSRSEPFYTYRRNYGLFNADLKLINTITRKEYNFVGEHIYCCDGGFSFRKFILPDTFPLGDYEVYGVIKEVASARYSQKIEVVK